MHKRPADSLPPVTHKEKKQRMAKIIIPDYFTCSMRSSFISPCGERCETLGAMKKHLRTAHGMAVSTIAAYHYQTHSSDSDANRH